MTQKLPISQFSQEFCNFLNWYLWWLPHHVLHNNLSKHHPTRHGSLDGTTTLVTIKATSTLAEDKILKAHLHWQFLLAKTSVVPQSDYATPTCIGYLWCLNTTRIISICGLWPRWVMQVYSRLITADVFAGKLHQCKHCLFDTKLPCKTTL